MGRPTKYKQKYCKMLIDHMSLGYPLETFATEINVHRDTLYEWARQNEEFSDTIKRGRDLSLKWWLNFGRAGMGGKVEGFNATIWIFSMKNLHHWRDRDNAEVVESLAKAKAMDSVSARLVSMNEQERLEYARELRDALNERLGGVGKILETLDVGVQPQSSAKREETVLEAIPVDAHNPS